VSGVANGGDHGGGGVRQSFFDLWSRFYDVGVVQRAIYRPVHETVLKELRWPPATRVVDVGCGTGILTSRLRTELDAAVVAGCDFSFGMLEQAAERTRSIAWMQGDALRLPLRAASADAIVCTEAFHWFPDHDAALHEFLRVLVPGGRLLVALVNVRAGATSRVAAASSQVLGTPAYWPTRDEMRQRVEAAGFEVRSQRRVVRIAGLLIPTVMTVGVKPGG
jgi:ubiquinone/menaquinone biosynthesis C-methylase UbiE